MDRGWSPGGRRKLMSSCWTATRSQNISVLCIHCSTGPLYPLFLWSSVPSVLWSSVPIVPLVLYSHCSYGYPNVPPVLCLHCSSGPFYPLVLWSSGPLVPWTYFSTGPLCPSSLWVPVPTVPLILCAYCFSGPLHLLFWSPVPTVLLVLSTHCSSGPLYQLFFWSFCAYCSSGHRVKHRLDYFLGPFFE